MQDGKGASMSRFTMMYVLVGSAPEKDSCGGVRAAMLGQMKGYIGLRNKEYTHLVE